MDGINLQNIWWLIITNITGWWFGTMEFYDFPFHILGMSSSQLTFTPSFFRGVGIPPTRWDMFPFDEFDDPFDDP